MTGVADAKNNAVDDIGNARDVANDQLNQSLRDGIAVIKESLAQQDDLKDQSTIIEAIQQLRIAVNASTAKDNRAYEESLQKFDLLMSEYRKGRLPKDGD